MPIGAIIAGIGAVTSIVGGISGANQASKNNSIAKKNAKEQQKAAKNQAKATNKYNEKLDFAKEFNYKQNANFSYNNAVKTAQKNNEIQDYKYLQSLKLYEKSESIKNQNKGLNSLAASQAVESELAAIDDMFLAQQFQNENALSTLKSVYQNATLDTQEQGLKSLKISSQKNMGFSSLQNTMQKARDETAMEKETTLIKGLIAQGKASLGQAGVSSGKRQQSTSAELQRGLMSLERQMTGEIKQAQIKMLEINADASLQQLGVGLNLQKIANTITDAEEEADYNTKVSEANMQSFLTQSTKNIEQINLQQKFADLNVEANSILFPEPLAYNPMPEMPPLPIFVKSMKATAAFVPSPAQQSTMAPLLQGIGGAATSLAGVDFSNLGGKGGSGFNPGDKSSNLFNNNISNFGGGAPLGAFDL